MLPPPIIPVTHWPEMIRATAARCIFVPALGRFPVETREMMGLLPVCDINEALLAALAQAPAEVPRHCVAGLFAADPFLDPGAMARALRRAGMAGVANYPTVQLIDGATGHGLAAVGYHARSEFVRLVEMKAGGFEVLAYVASAAAAEEALALGLDQLVLHPGLTPETVARAGLGRIEALAEAAGARLFRHAGFGARAGIGQPVSP